MKPEEIKLGFLRLDWDAKIQALRQAKESQDLGNYLTLLTWLDETPTRFGGVPIRHIPEEAFWSYA